MLTTTSPILTERDQVKYLATTWADQHNGNTNLNLDVVQVEAQAGCTASFESNCELDLHGMMPLSLPTDASKAPLQARVHRPRPEAPRAI